MILFQHFVKIFIFQTTFRISYWKSTYSYYLQSLCRLLLWKSDKYRLSKRNSGVITSKVCKDFQRESANTFAPSKVCIVITSKVCKYFRPKYPSIRNLELAEQRRANGVSTHPNSFSVPKEINGRLTHSLAMFIFLFYFLKILKVCKLFGFESLKRLSKWDSGQILQR